MKDSLYEQLVKDNPELFENNNIEFSVGNGWYNIMAGLLGIITAPLANAQHRLRYEREHPSNDGGVKLHMLEEGVQNALDSLPRLDQVKEKFGGLRFYYTDRNKDNRDYIAGAVRMAEEMADRTCHVCGSPGERRGGDWIQTLCDKHHKEQEDFRLARKEGRRLPAINYDAETED